MKAEYSETYALDRRFSVQFALSDGQLDARWWPQMPKGRKMRSLAPAYKQARHAFLSTLDMKVVVVDL